MDIYEINVNLANFSSSNSNWPENYNSGASSGDYDNRSSCLDHILNVTRIVKTGVAKKILSVDNQRYASLVFYVNNVIVPIICLFGIVGNVLNLVVLTRKQLQRSMDRLEKSVSVGLVALAASDMISCMLYMMTSLVQEQTLYSPLESHLSLYFKIYQEALVNIFLLCSTWLTVNMALGRYFAICHPLQARGFISLRGTRIAVVCVFLGSVIATLPRFWHYHETTVTCNDLLSNASRPVPLHCPCRFHTKSTYGLYRNNQFVFGYGLFCSVVSIFIPLVILTVCNVCLIRALRRSYRMQSLYRANKPNDSGHRITPTLIALIVLFTVLVAPADFVVFARLVDSRSRNYTAFKMTTMITNLLLLMNFAINFVLYCVVNVQFRKTVRDIVTCTWYAGQGRLKDRGQSTTYTRATQHACTMDTCAISETEIAL